MRHDRLDSIFTGMERSMTETRSSKNLLPLDGSAVLFAAVVSTSEGNVALDALVDELEWREESVTLFGRTMAVPRLTAWYGDWAYSYSGITHIPAAMPPTLNRLRSIAENVAGAPFNGVLANLYRDGADSMGWHSDNEPELGPQPVIASISLGGTRRFHLKHRDGSGDLVSLDLTHGSCLVMSGSCQENWRHQVPKTKKLVAPRVNLTFRYSC